MIIKREGKICEVEVGDGRRERIGGGGREKIGGKKNTGVCL